MLRINLCKNLATCLFLHIKNPQVADSYQGEFVIRVHLPFICSEKNQYAPDKFVQKFGYMFVFAHKKSPSSRQLSRGASYQGASTNYYVLRQTYMFRINLRKWDEIVMKNNIKSLSSRLPTRGVSYQI